MLDRTYDPVRFVVSTRLGETSEARSASDTPSGQSPRGPTTDRLDDLLGRHPGTELKLDPVSAWTDDLVSEIAATDAMRLLDLKGQYHGTVVDREPDPDLYERVFEGFPDAVMEDPAITDDTRELVEANAGRISWGAPITSVEALLFEPDWLNVKPSRFGTVTSLLETIEHCVELGVGREGIQLFASLFYPDHPNDVAPGGYNDPELPADLSDSPLSPPDNPVGLGW